MKGGWEDLPGGCWERILRKMERHKEDLARTGLVINKKDAMRPRFGLYFTVRQDGRRTQKCIALGNDVVLVRRARSLLHNWREHHRRRQFACSKEGQVLLMQLPSEAGYGSRTRKRFRKALRIAARDPGTLLRFLAGFDGVEEGFPGVRALREDD